MLDRLRLVLDERGARHRVALLLDTKGPEVRTAMLKDGKDINLEAGQELTVVAVGDKYTTWEGFKDEATGETRIGLSYQHLCRDVKVGGMIKIGDGLITLEVRACRRRSTDALPRVLRTRLSYAFVLRLSRLQMFVQFRTVAVALCTCRCWRFCRPRS